MTTKQEKFWGSDFGNEYTERNRVNWLDRVPFWTDIIARTGINSVAEVGANVGWNLLAIRTIRPAIWSGGIDVNKHAIAQANSLGLNVLLGEAVTIGCAQNIYDMVYTAGVLIHIGPSEIRPVMEAIVKASRRYVLAVEYEAEKEEEIDYRGHTDRLWRRPYGQLYQDMGLTLVVSGEAHGFDRCTYWLLEKKP